MNNFLKLNRLSLMIVLGSFIASSAEVSADCDLVKAAKKVYKKEEKRATCKEWPYGQGQHSQCSACLSEMWPVCHKQGTDISNEQQETESFRCFQLGEK